jgi:hypothetical protein
MALADESGLSRNCAEAVGFPPTAPKDKKRTKHDKLTWQLSRNGPAGPILEVIDDDDTPSSDAMDLFP